LRFYFSFILSFAPPSLWSQGKVEDYDRAFALREKFEGQAINVPDRPVWIEKTPRFWYRKTVKGGHEFILVDAEKATKRPAFDHEKLAAALNKETGEKFTATTLPFRAIRFVDDEKAIGFEYRGSAWRFDLATYELKKTGPAREFKASRMAGRTSVARRLKRLRRNQKHPLTKNGKPLSVITMSGFARSKAAKNSL